MNKQKILLDQGKLVGILGGDHSAPFGFYKAIAEKHDDFGILQIDAHCDLRKSHMKILLILMPLSCTMH